MFHCVGIGKTSCLHFSFETSFLKSKMAQHGRFDLRSNLFRIPDNISVALGLRWDFVGAEPVDLDASCVAFDDGGNCLDAVFFNHLAAEGGYMVHSGDNTTGEDVGEDDETIFFHMNKIPKDVCYLMVCVTSYTGADFTLVDKATCRLVNVTTREMVGEFSLGIVGRHNATLLCAFSRVPPLPNDPNPSTWWDMREINIPTNGYTFADVLPKMLDLLAIPEDQREVCITSLPDYPLTKEDASEMALSQLKLGLGWDGDNDLDASLIMVNSKGEYIDHVHAKFGKLKSNDGAVLHSGDKLNGYDVAGDDEFIEVDLNKVDKRVELIFFMALLYDGFAKTMEAVPHGYLRMQNKSSPMDRQYKEMDRFSLTKQGGDATAVILAAVIRKDTAHWTYHHLGELTQGQDWIDVYPVVRNLALYSSKLEEWAAWRQRATPRFAIEVSFLQARDLGPLEPHHFSCHCEAWVCDKKGKGRQRSKIVEDRETVEWSDSAQFVVSLMDRVRVMLFEHAMVGHVDLVMADMEALRTGTVVEEWFPLQGQRITGELKLRIRQIPIEQVHVQHDKHASSGGWWCVIA